MEKKEKLSHRHENKAIRKLVARQPYNFLKSKIPFQNDGSSLTCLTTLVRLNFCVLNKNYTKCATVSILLQNNEY